METEKPPMNECAKLIANLKQTLQQAEDCGKSGDFGMLKLLDHINVREQNIKDLAEETGEQLPDINFSQEAEHLEQKYLPTIIQGEIDIAKKLIERDSKMSPEEKYEFYKKKGGGYAGDGQIKRGDIENLFNYCNQRYPDMNLQEFKVQLEELKK